VIFLIFYIINVVTCYYVSQKTAPFYFCNKFVKSRSAPRAKTDYGLGAGPHAVLPEGKGKVKPRSALIIFGRHIPQ